MGLCGMNCNLRAWIRNDEVMNEEDDEAEGSRRSIPMKQTKISIQLSFHYIVATCYLGGSMLLSKTTI